MPAALPSKACFFVDTIAAIWIAKACMCEHVVIAIALDFHGEERRSLEGEGGRVVLALISPEHDDGTS